jgi:hypothetical protein
MERRERHGEKINKTKGVIILMQFSKSLSLS